MITLLAIVTGLATFFNYGLWTNSDLTYSLQLISIGMQIVLVLLTLFSPFNYRGRRSVPNYKGGWYKIWTIRFSIIMISLLGNISILIILLLKINGIISTL